MCSKKKLDPIGSQLLADYLLCESRERGELLTPLKLQKLMFYADAWFLALYDQELTPEPFEAWVHGPVAVSQYQRFKENKWRPIELDVEKPNLDEGIRTHLNEVVDVFGVESAVALEMMTHDELPWIEARRGIATDEPCNKNISKQTTQKFYRSLVEN